MPEPAFAHLALARLIVGKPSADKPSTAGMRPEVFRAGLAWFALFAILCGSISNSMAAGVASIEPKPLRGTPFLVQDLANFARPWAVQFLPDGRLLVSEKAGALKLYDPVSGLVGDIDGLPRVDYGGQGGLGDIALHPDFADNRLIYLSYAEGSTRDIRGAAVARGRLILDAAGGGKIDGLKVIWRQTPKRPGNGHYGHRLLFAGDGKLWVSSGERQAFEPAQDMRSNLGKLLRLDEDGDPLADNPFADQGKIARQIWSLGHRNPLGMASDAQGRLWLVEMGPAGGDELNLIERGGNYGYPVVSNGDHYDGRSIPDHGSSSDRGFVAPKISWTPVISPSSLIIYHGELFSEWRGDALISGLSSRSLVRVELHDDSAREAEDWNMGKRIRGVQQAADGSLWIIEDGANGRLRRLTPQR
jgi:glucose/arabinose dehydrogenase